MGPALTMADEKNAYILTDQGTWIRQSADFQIVPLVQGVDGLKNPYGAIAVNPDKHPSINGKLADRFLDFLVSEQTQQLIADYRVDGQPLFYPDRLPAPARQVDRGPDSEVDVGALIDARRNNQPAAAQEPAE